MDSPIRYPKREKDRLRISKQMEHVNKQRELAISDDDAINQLKDYRRRVKDADN